MDKQQKLEDEIENIQLENMSKSQITKTIKSLSTEGMKLRATRKKIRYKLYRLRTEAEGKCGSDSSDDFRKSFEDQPFFGGWKFFATNWDVAFDDPMRIVHRELSEQDEWDELVKAKFPQIIVGENGTKIHYPDINVRNAVQEDADKRKKSEKNKPVKKKKATKKVAKKTTKKSTSKGTKKGNK